MTVAEKDTLDYKAPATLDRLKNFVNSNNNDESSYDSDSVYLTKIDTEINPDGTENEITLTFNKSGTLVQKSVSVKPNNDDGYSIDVSNLSYDEKSALCGAMLSSQLDENMKDPAKQNNDFCVLNFAVSGPKDFIEETRGIVQDNLNQLQAKNPDKSLSVRFSHNNGVELITSQAPSQTKSSETSQEMNSDYQPSTPFSTNPFKTRPEPD